MTDYLNKLPGFPPMDFSEFGEIEKKPLGRIQSLTAGFLHRNWVAIPHVTHNDEVDATSLEAKRKAWNAANPDKKVSPLAPLVKAVISAMQEYPKFNTSLDPQDPSALIYKKYFHMGIAVDTPNGLLVPVVRDCDKKSILEINEDIVKISTKAREKGLSMQEMSGGCLTISSLGHIGGTSFSPIINSPEVAILGVTRLQQRPFPGEDGSVVWKSMLPLSLSYDHRVINGADAAKFVVAVGKALADIEF